MGDVRVLVVDDDGDARTAVRLMLSRREGCVVVGEAPHGAAAVELAIKLEPDAVMLDCRMPVLDGVAAIPLILAARPDTAIVMLSSDSTRRSDALAAGARLWCDKADGFGAAIDQTLRLVGRVH